MSKNVIKIYVIKFQLVHLIGLVHITYVIHKKENGIYLDSV
jgi:hypothetical protein